MGGTTFLWSCGGLGFPSPQTHPSPSHTFSLPYKLTHSASHPLQGQPNGPSEIHTKCRGLTGTPRVGDFYLPIPHPGNMCSGEKINNPHRPWHKRAIEAIKQMGSAHEFSLAVSPVDVSRNLLVNLCFAFDWSLHRSPQRPFHPAADLRKKSFCKSTSP